MIKRICFSLSIPEFMGKIVRFKEIRRMHKIFTLFIILLLQIILLQIIDYRYIYFYRLMDNRSSILQSILIALCYLIVQFLWNVFDNMLRNEKIRRRNRNYDFFKLIFNKARHMYLYNMEPFCMSNSIKDNISNLFQFLFDVQAIRRTYYNKLLKRKTCIFFF